MLRGIAAGRAAQVYARLQCRSLSLSATSSGLRDEEQYFAAIADRFHADADAAANSLANSLSSQHRAVLLKALGSEAQPVLTEYAHRLFRDADTGAPLQHLDK